MIGSNKIESFVDGIQRVKNVSSDVEFQRTVSLLREYLQNLQMPPKAWQRLEKNAYYKIVEDSEEKTANNRLNAQEKVIKYLESIIENSDNIDILYQILNNFYEFLAALREYKIHKRLL